MDASESTTACACGRPREGRGVVMVINHLTGVTLLTLVARHYEVARLDASLRSTTAVMDSDEDLARPAHVLPLSPLPLNTTSLQSASRRQTRSTRQTRSPCQTGSRPSTPSSLQCRPSLLSPSSLAPAIRSCGFQFLLILLDADVLRTSPGSGHRGGGGR
ncbi:hypothetical protein NMY22_g13450 [Coprinellus aureogranulatus]|nr:hypothetical protein NMY22_g13450 [Coprinellus aureogranulatus]